MDGTLRGDLIAAKMRKYYDANRPLTFWERVIGKRKSTDPGFADSLMIGLAGVCLREDRDLPPAQHLRKDQPK